jgi:Tripartite tricarboxylate transporter TctA family
MQVDQKVISKSSLRISILDFGFKVRQFISDFELRISNFGFRRGGRRNVNKLQSEESFCNDRRWCGCTVLRDRGHRLVFRRYRVHLVDCAVRCGEFALKFSSAEYFSLMLMGLVAAAVLSHGNMVKSLAMVVVGLLLGIIGADVNSGIKRFTFGFYELADGIGVVTIAVGVPHPADQPRVYRRDGAYFDRDGAAGRTQMVGSCRSFVA